MRKYELPDMKLDSREHWPRQRAEWVALAEDCLYGHAPEGGEIRWEVTAREEMWQGAGVKETVRIHYGPDFSQSFNAVVYSPAAEGRYPAITWNQFSHGAYDCCPYEEAVAKRGYIIARFDREEVLEDKVGGKNPAGEAYPAYDWGGVRAWAWAQSRLADYLLTRPDVDKDKLVCTGFSRGGKAALAAGIFDERFSVCAPINSGAGGCGCFRYLGDREGMCQDVTKVESMGRVGSVFPHWWGAGFPAWYAQEDPVQMGREQAYPFDLHILRALIAPRHLFTTEGLDDAWSNPWGTALTWRASQPAFDLLGGRSESYFRQGGHAFGEEDWLALLDFCDEVYFGRETGRSWNTCPFED